MCRCDGVGPNAFQRASAGCLKKGVATNQASLPQQLHVPWYYDWSITPLRAVPNNISFVPMFWGLKNVGKLAGPVPIILGFNEPSGSGPGQSNITVSQAIAAWPQVQSIALVVGAPAIGSNSFIARAWLTAFMSWIHANNMKAI